MRRRKLLQQASLATLSALGLPALWRQAKAKNTTAAIKELQRRLGTRLIRPKLPWANLLAKTPVPVELKNPWALSSQAGGTQSTGMVGAWTAQASHNAVRVGSKADVATAVDVARLHNLRLVIKGMGGDYFGRSSGPPNSLLIWTHDLNAITTHQSFTPEGAPASQPPVTALTVSAGNAWLHAYQAATAAGLYVQGGGCTTVGACGGFSQGGGFGSYSKRFGSGAAGVLQMEVVTADGQLRTVNAFQEPDLCWALKGGGGGTYGVVVSQTLLAHPIPRLDGWISGWIEASDDGALEELLTNYLELVQKALINPNWGEGVVIEPGQRRLQIMTSFIDLEANEAEAIWTPLLKQLKSKPHAFDVQVNFHAVPFENKWRPQADAVHWDRRDGAPSGQFWWKGNQNEVGAYWGGYQGRGVPMSALEGESLHRLAKAFVSASRTSFLLFQTSKGLAGISPEAESRQRQTSMNPAVLNDAGYVTLANWTQYRYPGISGHQPNPRESLKQQQDVDRAMAFIRAATPGGSSYVNEGNFFEPNWKQEFWGPNYERLLRIKRRYDPTNLFRVHHGVGSDT